MKQVKCYISNDAPNVVGEAMWLKPITNGFTLYILSGGSWKPLKLVNDNNTITPSDDKEKLYIEVTNIQTLTNKQCHDLNVGDQVIKNTGTQKHLYTVTYKDEVSGGLCLSYIDAENAETVAYDRVEDNWGYTDTTITPLV